MTAVASGCSSQGANRGGRKGLRGVRLSVRDIVSVYRSLIGYLGQLTVVNG